MQVFLVLVLHEVANYYNDKNVLILEVGTMLAIIYYYLDSYTTSYLWGIEHGWLQFDGFQLYI